MKNNSEISLIIIISSYLIDTITKDETWEFSKRNKIKNVTLKIWDHKLKHIQISKLKLQCFKT